MSCPHRFLLHTPQHYASITLRFQPIRALKNPPSERHKSLQRGNSPTKVQRKNEYTKLYLHYNLRLETT